jgi:hypothetical protein
MKRSTVFGVACAFLAGAALAFPAGLMLARHASPGQDRAARAGMGHARLLNPVSPSITSDPYIIEQQRKGLAALDRSCREAGTYCREAAQLRQWLEAHGGAS